MTPTKRHQWRNVIVGLGHVALLCSWVSCAHAAGALYARAIGEPPEPEPKAAPPPKRAEPAPPPADVEPPPPETEGVSRKTILLGVGIAAALAALGGGGGGGGGSTTSH